MNRNATKRKSATIRRHKYTKVLDHRKRPVRGLWRRNGSFYARITVEDESGAKKLQWAHMSASTVAEAQADYRKLLNERDENRVRFLGRAPTFGDYLDNTYLPLLQSSGKKPATIVTEKSHYRRWNEGLGHLRLDKIRPSHILEVLHKMRLERSPRTCNLAMVCLRHVLKAAKRDGFLKVLPTQEIPWQRTDKKTRRLFTLQEIRSVAQAAFQPLFLESRLADSEEKGWPLKNAQQLSDFLDFLLYTGAREQEALGVRWDDVDFSKKLVTIGAQGDTKNREARHVDLNDDLERHLRKMFQRRAPDSRWLFPSPKRGNQDARAKSFRESLKLARMAAGMHSFGFHDCRHHFISQAVMSGIDYLTIARWVGHKDGGILIGKVYGHLTNEHTQAQAAKLKFTASPEQQCRPESKNLSEKSPPTKSANERTRP